MNLSICLSPLLLRRERCLEGMRTLERAERTLYQITENKRRFTNQWEDARKCIHPFPFSLCLLINLIITGGGGKSFVSPCFLALEVACFQQLHLRFLKQCPIMHCTFYNDKSSFPFPPYQSKHSLGDAVLVSQGEVIAEGPQRLKELCLCHHLWPLNGILGPSESSKGNVCVWTC